MRRVLVLAAVAAASTVDASGDQRSPSRRPSASATNVLKTTVAARAIQPGEVIVLTVTSSLALDEVRVRAFGRDVPVFSAGDRRWRALLGVDVEVAPGRHTVAIEGEGGARAYRDTLALQVRRRVLGTRTLRVDPAFVRPPPDAEARIAEETRLLTAMWSKATAPPLWEGPFVRPVPGRSSSRFGSLSIFNGEPRSRHSGEDFASPEGTPVVAPNSGRVALARDLYFSGNTVVIDHGLGLFSLLAHLSAIDVNEGEDVASGQPLGLVGATGRVTGPHLHWAVRLNGARIDPSSVLATLGVRR